MIKMKAHGRKQAELMKEYEKKGYKIYVEACVPVGNSFFVVDIIAEKDGKRTAIEIGTCHQTKLDYLKTKFDEVIHIPYMQESKDGYIKHFCGYTWKPRVKNPKECPRCKTRLDIDDNNNNTRT